MCVGGKKVRGKRERRREGGEIIGMERLMEVVMTLMYSQRGKFIEIVHKWHINDMSI